jgi:hypothetical protein
MPKTNTNTNVANASPITLSSSNHICEIFFSILKTRKKEKKKQNQEDGGLGREERRG